MAAELTISSRNYSSWSLRGWLLCKLSGLDFTTKTLPINDPTARAELLHLSPSFLVPCLAHDGVKVWDTLAIAEYLDEIFPAARMYPENRAVRAQCRSVSGEMHAGFYNLRSALPMNLRARYSEFRPWAGAKADIARIRAIWQECLNSSGGPYLFGAPTVADAMFAPVCTRFISYGVELDPVSSAYCGTITAWAPMVEWVAAAHAEPDEIDELDAEF